MTKRFGQAVAVDGLDLEIEKGEFFSLLGPSGCGKTTTLRMVAGFEQPTEGGIHLDGEPVETVPPERNVNTVFQSYALFEHLSVEDNVAFGLKQQGGQARDPDASGGGALELVELRGREAARPRELSGGQKQRVALARALVNRPSVLLLDEPLGALDLKLRKQMQVELKGIQREVGITFLYVTTTRRKRSPCPTASPSWRTAWYASAARPRRSTSTRWVRSWPASSAYPTCCPASPRTAACAS